MPSVHRTPMPDGTGCDMATIAGYNTHAHIENLDLSRPLSADSKGWLTGYCLALGFEERVDFPFGSVRLYADRGLYFVASSATAECETFDNLAQAHERFTALVERVVTAMST